jgi:LysM repeat protein
MKRLWLIMLACASVVLVSGLLAGAAQADGAPVRHIVKPGDTLYRIAAQHNVSLAQLAAANNIYNVNVIHIGQVLTIPGDRPAISLTAPAWDADAPSPLTVSGQSTTFEGNVQIRLYDSAYRVVGSSSATGGSMGEYANFTATLTYTVPFTQPGVVEAYEVSARDGSATRQADVRVRLTSVKPGAPPPPPRIHIVQPGDTLYRLALRYGTTAHAIAQANNIANINLIYVGQKLIIP